MASHNDFVDRLRIASPCPANWEQMSGDDRVRFCDLCNLHVYDISRLTRREAESLIVNTEGRICARLFRRIDGTIITRDCPVGLRAIRRRVAKVAGAAFAAIMSLCGNVGAQKPAKKESCQAQITISRSQENRPGAATTISGTVFDPNKAVIAGATISAVETVTKQTRKVNSNDDGTFQITGLARGRYDLRIESPGFKIATIKALQIDDKTVLSLDVVMLIDSNATMGIIVEPSLLDRNSTIKTTISGDLIRRLPH
jgi:hypothetical protein